MFEIIKFKSILKNNKNVFADIINDMTIKTLRDNTITFVDYKGNETIAVIDNSNILFRFDDKKSTVVNLPQDDNNEYVKVIDVIKEERDNGCIIEVIEKYYDFTIESEDEKVLVDLVSNRYVFDKNISIDDINNFEQLCKIPTIVDMASEFRYNNPLIDSKTLFICISQSGETADTIAALKLANSMDCTTIAIVNVQGSSITRYAHHTLYTHAGPEIAVASTKAYTCQLTLLTLLALYMSERLFGESKLSIDLKKELLHIPEKIAQSLETNTFIETLSNEIYKNNDSYFIGRGSDYAVALEGSLKLKEISYIHSEAYAAGELKHGPIALIEQNVPVIGIATNQLTFEKTLNNLEEALTRGGKIILITNTPDYINASFDTIVKIPEVHYLLSPIISVIPLQLLAYHIAKNKKLDVDKPRNLAKSVTVE